MENFSRRKEIIEILIIALILVTGVVILPLIIGFFENITFTAVLGLITSILIFQPFAVVIGIGLGFDALPLMFIMCSIGLSVIFGLLKTCDMFANRSEWLHRHLEKVEAVTQKSRLLKKYGMVAFIPFIWVPGIGLYGCVMIAWLLRWRGAFAITMLLIAWMLAALIVLLTSMGLLSVFQ